MLLEASKMNDYWKWYLHDYFRTLVFLIVVISVVAAVVGILFLLYYLFGMIAIKILAGIFLLHLVVTLLMDR